MKQQYISIRHLSKKFNKDFVLKDINAVLNSNEILGFLGPSGAGKTTTIKILTGQLKPTSGNAEILGIECDKINERIYEQIGIVTDSSGVYERMNLYDNLKYFARFKCSFRKYRSLIKTDRIVRTPKKNGGKTFPKDKDSVSFWQERSFTVRKYSFWMNLQTDLIHLPLMKYINF